MFSFWIHVLMCNMRLKQIRTPKPNIYIFWSSIEQIRSLFHFPLWWLTFFATHKNFQPSSMKPIEHNLRRDFDCKAEIAPFASSNRIDFLSPTVNFRWLDFSFWCFGVRKTARAERPKHIQICLLRQSGRRVEKNNRKMCDLLWNGVWVETAGETIKSKPRLV